jgi:hypothetical protein
MAASVVHARENKLPKRERFAAEFYYRLDNLVQTLTPMLITRHHEMGTACRLANVALSYLLRVWCTNCAHDVHAHTLQMSLTLLDKAPVFRLIYYYADRVDRAEPAALRDCKLDFMHVFSEHEHWLPLSLPTMATSSGLVIKTLKGT